MCRCVFLSGFLLFLSFGLKMKKKNELGVLNLEAGINFPGTDCQNWKGGNSVLPDGHKYGEITSRAQNSLFSFVYAPLYVSVTRCLPE